MIFLLLACQQQASPEQPSKPTQSSTVTSTVTQGRSQPSQASKKKSFAVYFFDAQQNLKSVQREGDADISVQYAVDILYKGPTEKEKTSGLTLLRCKSTGAQVLSIKNGLARIQLTGDCGGCSGVSIYEPLVQTIKQFQQVQYVHVLDPSGKTQALSKNSHARPSCLEP